LRAKTTSIAHCSSDDHDEPRRGWVQDQQAGEQANAQQGSGHTLGGPDGGQLQGQAGLQDGAGHHHHPVDPASDPVSEAIGRKTPGGNPQRSARPDRNRTALLRRAQGNGQDIVVDLDQSGEQAGHRRLVAGV